MSEQDTVDFYDLLPNPVHGDDQDLDNSLYLPSSKYYAASELNDNFKRHDNVKPFSCIHFNLRSLPKNFHELCANLATFENEFDIVAISETRLNDKTVVNTNIPGYDFFQDDSPTAAGGVGLYISKFLKASFRPDLKLKLQQVESCWVEFKTANKSSTIVGCIYKHPRANIEEFMVKLESILNEINNNKQTVYILGDMNIDLLKYDSHLPTENYIDMLFANFILSYYNQTY